MLSFSRIKLLLNLTFDFSFSSPFSPPSPPELPTLYKRSITHFRSLFTLSRTLPTHRLYERLKSNIDIESNLKLGCRIGLGNTIEGQDELEEIPLNQVVGNAEKDFLTSIKKQDHLQTHKFGDILTPIGNLKCSVTYRTNVEFSVDDVENLGGLKDLDVDEDFFKPASIIPVVAAAKVSLICFSFFAFRSFELSTDFWPSLPRLSPLLPLLLPLLFHLRKLFQNELDHSFRLLPIEESALRLPPLLHHLPSLLLLPGHRPHRVSSALALPEGLWQVSRT